ncbi:MAG: F0F1 ATP synthase subunit B [Candidatus Pacebacteria bacterium]|nr:F0F1 ATP synthase subunit B [Candidatus Paceibacterota bacterium]
MDSLIETFHIDWRLIIAQMVNFAIVIFVLYRFAIKPLGKLMQERSAKIVTGLTDAKKHKELLENTEIEYKKIIAGARKESQELIGIAKKDAEIVRLELVAKAQDDAKKLLKAGKEELEAEKMKMLSDAKKELGGLIASVAQKVLGNVVDTGLQEKISNEVSKDL